MSACKYNYYRRLKIIHQVLSEKLRLNLADSRLRTENGMTCLHVATLNNSTETTEYILENCDKSLLFCQISDGIYQGATCLHFCVLNQEVDIISDIFELLSSADKRKLIQSQTTGSFMYDKIRSSGTSLGMAATSGFRNICQLLVKNGAEIDMQDLMNGDTIFHSLVRYSLSDPDDAIDFLDMIIHSTEIEAWFKDKFGIRTERFVEKSRQKMRCYLLKLENNNSYTPLTLASRIGAHEMLMYLLQLEGVYKHTSFTLGNSVTSMYELDEIDTAVGGITRPGKPCVLDHLVYGLDDDDIPALKAQPIKSLIANKWRAVRIPYIFWALVHIGFLIYSTETALKLKNLPPSQALEIIKNMNLSDAALKNITRSLQTDPSAFFLNVINEPEFEPYLDELKDHYASSEAVKLITVARMIAFLSAFYLLMGIMGFSISLFHLIQSYICQSCCHYYKSPLNVLFKHDAFQLVLLIFSVSGLGWFISLEMDTKEHQNTLLALVSITGWYFCLFFTRVFRSFSFFTAMLHRILVGDVLRFAVVFLVVLLGFGAAIRVIFAEQLLLMDTPEELNSASKTFQTMYRLMLGLNSMDYIDDARQKDGAVMIFVLFTGTTTILLLNMLIAAMSDTYAKLNVNGESLWHKQRIASVLWMEHFTPKCLLNLTTRNYSTFHMKKGVYLMSVTEIITNMKHKHDILNVWNEKATDCNEGNEICKSHANVPVRVNSIITIKPNVTKNSPPTLYYLRTYLHNIFSPYLAQFPSYPQPYFQRQMLPRTESKYAG